MLHFTRWKILTILGLIGLGILFALPNMFSKSQLQSIKGYLPSKQINLGLDLRGGSHLLLEVNTSQLRDEWLDSVREDIRARLREARIGYTGLGMREGAVQVRIRDTGDFDKARTEITKIRQPLQGSVFGGTGAYDLDISEADGGVFSLTPTEGALTERINSGMAAAIETIRRRVDELGTTEPNIQREGRERILVQVPGLDNPQQLKQLIGKVAKLSFHMVHPTMTASEAAETRVPIGYVLRTSVDGNGLQELIEERAGIRGEDLVDSQPSFDQRTNEPVVTFRFNSSGARRFAKLTQDNVGRRFAIELDKEVISAPVIREAILGGTGQISGSFTVETANNLAILLRSGALPADIEIIEERTVGPSLGADSINAGVVASIVGLIAVIGFMLAAYGLFGLFSVAALVVNLALIVGILTALQATLTLPGIAGIVLTIGMAVDANVLIFERVREELRSGRSPINAIETGFERALGTIVDSQLTTLIAAIVLFWLGSGPIRGFAITLSIGIATSVFTAFTVTRLLVSLWLKRQRDRRVKVIEVPV